MEFNERLRLIRKTEGYTQKEFAKLLNSSEIGIRLYETNKRTPNGWFFMVLGKKFPEYSLWLNTGKTGILQTSPKIVEKRT